MTIGACGSGGGRLKSMVGHCFHVRADDMQIVEDVHMVLARILMRVLDVNQQCS